MKSHLQLQLVLFLFLFVCPKNMGQGTQPPEPVLDLRACSHCNLSDFVWNITKPVEKEWVEWVDIALRNTCKYCDAKDVNLGLVTVDLTCDKLVLRKSIPAGRYEIFRYQTRDSVVDQVQIVRADFVNCHP